MYFLFFDCDGVLVDTEAVAARVVTSWLKQKGCNIEEDEFIVRYTGQTFGSIFKELIEEGQLLREHWKDDVIRKLEHTIYEQIVAVNGIEECLEDLKKSPKAVISNSRESMVKVALKTTKLDKYLDIDKIFSAENVEKPKPSPLVYQSAVTSLELKTENCIAIEDSFTGVKAAVAAGIKTIGFCGASHQQENHDKRLIAAGAAAIAYHATDISKIINSLNGR